MSSELEAENIRIGDTIRKEYYKRNAVGDIAVEKIVQTEEYLEILKDEIRDGLYKAVYLLDRPTAQLPTEPGLYYRNVYNEDEPLYAGCIYELSEEGDWYESNGRVVSDDHLEVLREGRYPLERLVFEK